jgi:hypothetical protein
MKNFITCTKVIVYLNLLDVGWLADVCAWKKQKKWESLASFQVNMELKNVENFHTVRWMGGGDRQRETGREV